MRRSGTGGRNPALGREPSRWTQDGWKPGSSDPGGTMKRAAFALISTVVLVGGMVGVRPAGAAGPTLDVTPETPEQDQGTQVTFTAAVSPAQGGLDIDFELF